MKNTTLAYYNEFFNRYPKMEGLKDSIMDSFNILYNAVINNNTIFTCGNGGSASDSLHIVGELQKSFMKKRSIKQEVIDGLDKVKEYKEELLSHLEGSIKAISLVNETALSTAYINDNCQYTVYAQSLNALGECGDTLIAISTSGNSKNVLYAAALAKAKDIKVIALTGSKNSKLEELSDVVIKAPETETFKIQECHLPIYHLLCQMLEEEYFD